MEYKKAYLKAAEDFAKNETSKHALEFSIAKIRGGQLIEEEAGVQQCCGQHG